MDEFKQSKPADANPDSSKGSSLYNEKNLSDSEKYRHVPVSRISSLGSKDLQQRGGETLDNTRAEDAEVLENPRDEPEYPSGIKLAIITTALCVSVFCMALVSCCW